MNGKWSEAKREESTHSSSFHLSFFVSYSLHISITFHLLFLISFFLWFEKRMKWIRKTRERVFPYLFHSFHFNHKVGMKCVGNKRAKGIHASLYSIIIPFGSLYFHIHFIHINNNNKNKNEWNEKEKNKGRVFSLFSLHSCLVSFVLGLFTMRETKREKDQDKETREWRGNGTWRKHASFYSIVFLHWFHFHFIHYSPTHCVLSLQLSPSLGFIHSVHSILSFITPTILWMHFVIINTKKDK